MDNTAANNAGSPELKEDVVQYLTFKVGNEIYGVDVANVREVINFDKVFSIPAVPDYIRGVINLRGEVVPVIDLSYRFYSRKSAETRLTSIVIMEISADGDIMHIGIVIDAINAVLDINPGDIEHTPEFGSKIRADFISGVGKTDGKFIILLNIARVLDVSELADFVTAMH